MNFWGRTYIDRSFSYQFVFSLSQDRTHIDRSFILPISSVRRPGFCFSMTFKVTSSVLVFKVVVHTHPDILSHYCSSILRIQASFSSPGHLVLIVCSSFSSGLPLPLHMTWSFEITKRISVMLLGTLHLAFSCISHKESPLDALFLVLQGGSTITHL